MRPLSRFAGLRAAAIALLATALAIPTIAMAEDEPDLDETGSFYLDYMAGVSHSPKGTIRGANSASIGLFGKSKQKPAGYFIGTALGGYVADNIRLEVQIGFRNSEINRIKVQGEPSGAKNSTLSMLSVMTNAYYDFDLRDRDIPVVPWVGLGLGWGMPRFDAQNQAGPMQLDIDDTDSTMVYNFMGGLTWPFTDQAELVLGYRYLASIEFRVRGTQSGLSQRFEYEYSAHEGYSGIRFRF
jgi:opacity protein-like surface antigen